MTDLNAASTSSLSITVSVFSNMTLALSLWTVPLGHMLPPVNKYANTDKHTQQSLDTSCGLRLMYTAER